MTIAATTSGTEEVLTADGQTTAGAEITTSPPRGLTPTTERAVTTSLAPTNGPVGAIELLSEQQRLPSLGVPGDNAPDGDAPDDDAADGDAPNGGDVDTRSAADDGEVDGSGQEPLAYTAADGQVITPERIFAFLDGRNAPLAGYAETFVAAGIAHDVDPRVVVAIAIAESDAGKMHPEGTYNAWGWGGSGGPRGLRAWDSWEQSIDQYTERLGELYDTDNVDWDFASTYCPPNTQWWFDTVIWAMRQI